MIKTTMWTVGTCGCKIFYNWDSDDPEVTRVHTYSQIDPCEYHKFQNLDSDLHKKCEDVASENRKIGKAALVVEEATNGEVRAEEVGWEFDENRNISVKIPKEKNQKHKKNILSKLSGLGIGIREVDG